MKIKKQKIIAIAVILISIISTVCLIYPLSLLTGIENKIRLLLSIDLIIVEIAFIFGFLRTIGKKKSFFILTIFTIIYSLILIFIGYYINKTYKIIDKLTVDTTTYSTSLVTLSTNKINKLKDIKENNKIGMIDDETDLAGYQLPKQVVSENRIKNKIIGYSSYIDLIKDLYNKKIDYIFLPSNYVTVFSNMEGVDLEDIGEKTKIVYTKDKIEQTEKVNEKTDLTKPFTILIMGVDSKNTKIANSAFNGDALMLLTFNPKTLNTTILSIPRDSYVPVTCMSGQPKHKITSAALYGEKCMINTVSNFTKISIDYYVKINFKGVVNIIDALGGVEVDVPYSFCEQDSNRKFGKNTIYVQKGKQTLNGEQALALSRNRKSNSNKCSSEWTKGTRNDFVRGQNQQLVLRAILNKLKTIRSLDTIYEILNKVSESMVTNMKTSEILSLYNIGKDIIVKSNNENVEDLLGIQKLYLNGYDAYIYDQTTKLKLYNYVLYENSVNKVTDAMKVNLDKKKPTMVKKFSFDIDTAYKEEVIGKNVSGGNSNIVYLPNFIGMTEASAKNKASSVGLNPIIKYATTGSGTNGTVIKQSHGAKSDVANVKNLTLTILKKEEVTPPINPDNSDITTSDNQ